MKKNKLALASTTLVLFGVLAAAVALFVPEPAFKSDRPESTSELCRTSQQILSDEGLGSSAEPVVPRGGIVSGVDHAPERAKAPAPNSSVLPARQTPRFFNADSGTTAASLEDTDSSSRKVGAGNSGTSASVGYRSPSEILDGKDLADPEQRALAVTEMQNSEEARYASVLAKAAQLGIPARVEGSQGGLAIIHDFRGDQPLYRTTLNANAAISTGANLVRQTAPYNLDGSGIRVGIWDGGSVRNTHQEFSTNRVVKKNPSAANDDHATHVAGTIGATGVKANAKGMAPLVAIDSYDWNSDYAEMTAAGAASSADSSAKIPISNHSYGYNATAADMGRYESECNATDALAAGLPYYLVFWAAGNEQDLLTSLGGYQSITFNALAKNIMTIGAADDAVTSGVRDASKGTLASFSSMGPSDDGRIKPDIVANGVNVYSCVATGTNTYDGTYSGTSMATPNAAGSAALLQQLHKTNFSGQLMRASMLKALLIHTADDMGRPGPDYQYGWGYMNVIAAADIILAQKANPADPKLLENSVDAANRVRTSTFVWDGYGPIRATLAWTDPAGAAQSATNSRTRNLVNDLDLKITAPDGTTSYLPYVMPFVGAWTASSMTSNAVTGTNKVDNVERIDIAAPTQRGTYTLTVGFYGTNNLSGASQTFSLVLTGGQSTQPGPSPSPTPVPSPTPTPSPTPSPTPTPVPTPVPTPPPSGSATFAASDLPLVIPDNSAVGVASTINVTSVGQISVLSVSANITHPYKGDLRVTLISPSGTSVVLHNQTGSSQDNVILANVPVTAFNNASAAGQWKLLVQDLSRYDTGTLNSWSLTVTTIP